MAKILGLSGVFFKCMDLDAYKAWWGKHMGVDITDWGTMEWVAQDVGPHGLRSMFSPFSGDTEYLNPSTKEFMVNLRVDDVRTLIEKARAGGAKIIDDVQDTEFGVFGWFIDPEGIKIELWQEPSA